MAPTISMTYVDEYGRTTKRAIEVEPQATLAEYEAIMTAFVAAVTPMTDLGLLRIDLVLDTLVSGFAVTADANVDVGATFTGFITDGDGKKASHKVPGIKASLVSADGSIDVANETVAAYLAQFLAAGPFKISDGETVASWIRGILDR